MEKDRVGELVQKAKDGEQWAIEELYKMKYPKSMK